MDIRSLTVVHESADRCWALRQYLNRSTVSLGARAPEVLFARSIAALACAEFGFRALPEEAMRWSHIPGAGHHRDAGGESREGCSSVRRTRRSVSARRRARLSRLSQC